LRHPRRQLSHRAIWLRDDDELGVVQRQALQHQHRLAAARMKRVGDLQLNRVFAGVVQ